MMRTRDFLNRVAERAGVPTEAAGQLTQVTLFALGTQLHATQAAELASELPAVLGAWVGTARSGPTGLAPLLEAIARVEPGSLSFTAEHAGTVCAVLAEALRPEALRALREAVPDDVAALLQRREEPPFEHVTVDRSKRTLAEADSVSERPLFRSRG